MRAATPAWLATKRSRIWHHGHHSPPTSTITRFPAVFASATAVATSRAASRDGSNLAGRSAAPATTAKTRGASPTTPLHLLIAHPSILTPRSSLPDPRPSLLAPTSPT